MYILPSHVWYGKYYGMVRVCFTWGLGEEQKGRPRTSKVAFIASNPDKSKHLETATLRIDNFWVDFVNLRTESYLQDSRIPSINIGTPMEDAYRRYGKASR